MSESSFSVRYRYGLAVLFAVAGLAGAAQYRITPATSDVVAGQKVPLVVEVMTESGDNLVGAGHFAFSIDLTVAGTAGATASSISDMLINAATFDDSMSQFMGTVSGNVLKNVGGAAMNVFGPNAGSTTDDVVQLFTFNLAVPLSAALGSTISVTPSEGVLKNVTVNENFDPVNPQVFSSASMVVVPEPTGSAFVLAGLVFALHRRRS